MKAKGTSESSSKGCVTRFNVDRYVVTFDERIGGKLVFHLSLDKKRKPFCAGVFSSLCRNFLSELTAAY